MHDTGLQTGVGAISVINRHFGRDWLRVGAYRGGEGKPEEVSAKRPPFAHQGRGVYVADLIHKFPGAPLQDYRTAEVMAQ